MFNLTKYSLANPLRVRLVSGTILTWDSTISTKAVTEAAQLLLTPRAKAVTTRSQRAQEQQNRYPQQTNEDCICLEGAISPTQDLGPPIWPSK